MSTPRSSPPGSHRLMVAAVLALGFVTSVISYRIGWAAEQERAEAEFVHRATLRHALTREIMGNYEDALFGLSTLFMSDEDVTPTEFVRVVRQLDGRIAGAQAYEWVALVMQEHRAEAERKLREFHPRPHADIKEPDGAGGLRRAGSRPFYYAISYVEPIAGNEAALGFDLNAGPTRTALEQARSSRRMIVTPQFRLVQEPANALGVVLVHPVFRGPKNPEPSIAGGRPAEEVFAGFLQCVFRVRDMLEATHSQLPNSVVDMLFVDMSETDPTKRVLLYRPADDVISAAAVTEAEFRRGPTLEQKLPFGQRDWRVIYRPRTGSIESEHTSMPLLRSCSLLLLSGLVAGLLHIVGRRTETIRHEVQDRTAELAESRRLFASLLHSLPGMAYRCRYDEQLSVLFLSEGARELTGWTAEEFRQGVVHFRDCIHPDDLNRVRDATRTALDERVDVEVEYRIRTRQGGEKWVLSRGRGVYADDGKLEVMEGLAIDITAQKEAESARLALERKILEGQKLESLGLLAGGIAHDFNNLLSSILGNACMARLAVPAGNQIEAHLRAIEAASMRAAELCRQMLAYAGKGRFVVEPTNLTALTEDLLPLLKISIGHQAALQLKLERELPAVMADATQLRQIVMNLVLNAADAIGSGERKGGEIVVTTGVMEADESVLNTCVAGAGLARGSYVFLDVKDTGGGMTPEVLAKIFDPFFTTKFAGRGLGLAAVLGIVRGHHGALKVESASGLGSTFRLMLPPARQAVLPPKPVEVSAANRGKYAGRALVVDDEEQLRFLMVQMLKSFGFTPTAAEDGQAGLEAFRANPEGFDLVLLDVMMPRLNGEQTLEALRALKPDVRVLLMSGYAEGDILRRLGGGPTLAFLSKPFTRDMLETKIRALLG